MKNFKEIKEFTREEFKEKLLKEIKDNEIIKSTSLELDFLQILGKNPNLGKQLISYYFEFTSCIEVEVEDMIHQEISKEKETKNQKLLDKNFQVFFKIKKFPRVRLNYKSFSMINSMVKNNSGCLIYLDKIFILEISKKVNFAKKFLYRKSCSCCPYKTKIKKVSLREYIKLNCDQNSSYKVKKAPSCYQCGTKMTEDKAYTVYTSHKIMKVIIPSNYLDNEMELFFEKSIEENFFKENEMQEIKVGDQLSGLFYLDHLLKYSTENGRLVGSQKLHLLAVEPKLGAKLQNKRKRNLIVKPVNYFEKSYKKNYEISFLKKDRSIDNEAFNVNMTKILTENIKSLNEDHWYTDPMLTLVTYMGMFSHLTNVGKFTLKGDQKKIEIISKLGDLNSMFVLFWTRDMSVCVRRIEELCSYYTKVVFFPAHADEKSLKKWFIVNKKNFIVVPNFLKIEKKMASVLYEVIEKREVSFKGNHVRVNPTLIILLNPDFLKKPKKFEKAYPSLRHNFKSHFIDSFDICINLSTKDNKYKSIKNSLTEIDSIHKLTKIFQGQNLKETEENEKYSHISKISKSPRKSVIFGEEDNRDLSQHTRVSNLCKRVINRYNFKSPSRKVKRVRKDQIQELLSTELPKKNYVDGVNLLESYLEEAKFVKKVSLRNIKSLKKIVISLRIFRLTSCGFYSMIKSLYKDYNSNSLQTSIFDSLFGIAIFEESLSNLNGLQSCLFDNLCSKVITDFCDSVISQKSLKEFDEFYMECETKDVCDTVKELQEEVFRFCGVSC